MTKQIQTRMGVIAAVILIAVLAAFPLKERINLGLDLKGGMHLVLEVEVDKLDANARQDAVERAIEILRNRIDSLGVAEPVIQRQGLNQIIVQLPGITDRGRALAVIGQVAQLEFSLVEPSPELLRQALEGNVPQGYLLKWMKGKNEPILIHATPELTGEAIEDARVDFDSEGFAQPKVALAFKAAGARKFGEITRAHVNDRLAIVLDGEVLSAPNINEPILSGRAEISGQFTDEEAALLSLSLRSGSLPAPMRLEEERTIGPLLGQESINDGLLATAIGGILVVLFMIGYYRLAGFVSVIALTMNLLLIVGVMGSLKFLLGAPVTLTLPGIAGIVLTLGMAVDANVLINERIREEMENGVPLNAGVARGFSKAFSAIIDSNLTTLIAAFMLFQFGSGPIKGFAVTLSIGLLVSLFTALFVSRTIFMFLLDRGIKGLSMMRLLSKTRIDFVGLSPFCIILSVAVIGIGMTSFIKNQDAAYGIDFAGGQVQEYRFEKAVDPKVVREQLLAAGIADVTIQQFAESPETIVLRTSADTELAMATTFKEQMPDNPFEVLRIEKVGPVVGAELRKKALLAVIFALVGILVYVGFRFKHFDFATAGVIALLHDVVVALGILSLLGRQVDLLIVTALLTIAGYSINDTIVIYDRVREKMQSRSRLDLKEIINSSINETLGRTILTTVTTLLVVVALFLKGGELLNTFALCLMVGFVAGTYSTVFIAAPLVLLWHKVKRPA